MNMSNRTRQIIEILLQAEGELTVGEIAQQIDVSARTIHRELTNVEQYLTAFHMELIRKSGSGIKLSGSPEQQKALVESLSSIKEVDYTAEDRQLLILCLLLTADEPIKLFALGYDLKVAVSTITNDLNMLEKWVKKWRVTLVRKRGLGVVLSGTETQLRELIRQLIKLRLDPTELITDPLRLEEHPLYQRLFQLAGKSIMSDVESTLWLWEEQWESHLSEEAYTDLLLRLSIAINRIRSRRSIQQGEWKKLRFRHDLHESTTELLIELLSKHFAIEFTNEEKTYIYFIIAKVHEEYLQSLLGDDLMLTQAIGQITQEVERTFKVDFSEDRSLRDGLFHHMKVSLQRLSDGHVIRNPLLEHIMKDYDELFATVRTAAARHLPNIDIPNEEIGFIVTHFGAALERSKQLQPDVHAILVCSTGIGSSKLLQVRLQKEFPQIRIVDRVSWYEASRIPKERYDMIISTIDLPINPSSYLKVSPLITQEDADHLLAYIRTTAIASKPYADADELHANSAHSAEAELDQLMSHKITLDQILWILEQFEVVQLEAEYENLPSVLEAACFDVQQKELIVEPDLVKQRLLDREKKGTQMIPGTNLALFHTRSTSILTSSLTLYRLSKPIEVDKQQQSRLDQFLLMLAPQSLPWESLEVLSEISALLLEDELIELLHRGEEQSIRHYLTTKLHAFYKTKQKGE